MSKDSSSNSGELSSPVALRISKAILLVFGTIVLFFIGQIVGVYLAIMILMLFGKDSSAIQSLLTDNSGTKFFAVLLIEIITIGALWWLHSVRKQPFLQSVGLDKRPKIKFIGYSALTYVVYFVTLLIVVAIMKSLIPAIDVNQAQQLGFDSAKGFDLVFVFLTLVVLPPLAEEILFRGFLFSRLKTQIGVYLAAIITSVIFALAHTEFLGDNPLNWIAALDTFVFSFFLIFLYVKTKSLWPSIFLHGIKNCLAFTFLFLF